MMASNGINYKPVGIFWDIENCSVPKNKSACAVIAHIRNFFVINRLNHREYEFLVACDVSRIRKDVPDDVNRAGGVTLAHVSGSSKNAADEKLREIMKKFVDTHTKDGTSPVLVLVSGDIDFVNDLRGYQMRLGCVVVLIHAVNCSPQFKIGWNEIYSFQDFCAAVPFNPSLAGPNDGPKPNADTKQPKQGVPGPKPQGPKQQQQGGPGPKQQGPPGPKQQQGGPGPKQQGPPGPKPQKQKGPQNGQFQQGPNDGQNQQSLPDGKVHHGSGGNPKGPKQPNEQQFSAGPPNQNQPKKTKGPGPNPSGNNQQGQGQQGQNPGKKKGPPGQQQQGNSNPPVGQMGQMNIQGPGPEKKPDVPKFILMVSGLPGKMDFHILKDHLQEKANAVHGKVKYVKNGQAFISFNHKANADRAVELFNGKDVYGKSLNVTFVQKIPFENPIDKKLKGGTAPENFVMVNHGDVSGAPGPKNPKSKKYGDGGYQGQASQAPGNHQGQNVVAQAQRQQQQSVPSNWQESVMNDPSFAGHLGKFAGAVIRECALNNSGPTTNGRRGQNQSSSDTKDACSIQ